MTNQRAIAFDKMHQQLDDFVTSLDKCSRPGWTHRVRSDVEIRCRLHAIFHYV